MTTLLDATRSPVKSSLQRKNNPVDEALWGLAERLASTVDVRAPRETTIEASVETRFPTKTNGLPQARRVGARPSVKSVLPRIAPQKQSVVEPETPSQLAGAAVIHRVEFTILKQRRGADLGTTADRMCQDSDARGEHSFKSTASSARKSQRRRGGVTFAGWLLMIVGASVAAAIAFWAPTWF